MGTSADYTAYEALVKEERDKKHKALVKQYKRQQSIKPSRIVSLRARLSSGKLGSVSRSIDPSSTGETKFNNSPTTRAADATLAYIRELTETNLQVITS